MLQSIEAGISKFELKDYAGLAVGDILEVDGGTDIAEVLTVVKFGSIYVSAPTRFPHAAGASIRRLIEGNGTRWEQPPFRSQCNWHLSGPQFG